MRNTTATPRSGEKTAGRRNIKGGNTIRVRKPTLTAIELQGAIFFWIILIVYGYGFGGKEQGRPW